MKIYAVAGGSPSWRNSGYGHALLAGNAVDVLVSFEEFSKKPEHRLAVTTMAPSYEPKVGEPEPQP